MHSGLGPSTSIINQKISQICLQMEGFSQLRVPFLGDLSSCQADWHVVNKAALIIFVRIFSVDMYFYIFLH